MEACNGFTWAPGLPGSVGTGRLDPEFCCARSTMVCWKNIPISIGDSSSWMRIEKFPTNTIQRNDQGYWLLIPYASAVDSSHFPFPDIAVEVVECSRFRGFITWKCQSTTFGIGHCRWNGNGTCTYTCLGEFGLAVGWVGGWLRWWTFINMQDLMIGFFIPTCVVQWG